MYFCQTVTIFGYTSWAPLMPVFARSFAVGNRQLCLSLMMFRRDKGKYFQVMLECVLFFGTSACTSKSHYHPYIPYIYTYVFVFINQREFSWINVSLSADAESVCVRVSCRAWKTMAGLIDLLTQGESPVCRLGTIIKNSIVLTSVGTTY